MPQGTFLTSNAGANATSNPLNGWAYEFLPWPARVKILASSDKTLATIQVYSGSESIVDPSPLTLGTINVLPSDLNTHPIIFDAPAGDRLRVNFANQTAATQLQMLVLVTPL